MNPHTPVLYFDPRRVHPEVPRAAVILRATDKPGHAYLAVFSDPEFDIGRLPVEQARYVPVLDHGQKPAGEIAYCTRRANVIVLDSSKLSPGDIEALTKSKDGAILALQANS